MIPQADKQIIAKFDQRSVCQNRLEKSKICYALVNQMITILDLDSTKLIELKTNHEKRINNIKNYDNMIATCSNDSTIKLWDKHSYKPIHSFKKIPDQFNSVAISKHIVAGGGDGRIIFWDLRNMKQRCNFKDSFNGEITGLQFDKQISTILYGCCTDGFFNCFDLSQANEQEAAKWFHRLDNAPQELKIQNKYLNIHTTDNSILILDQECVIKKISPSTPLQPKHLLWSYFSTYINYYVWNSNLEIIEKWKQNVCTHQSEIISDIDFMEEVTDTKSIYIDQKGNVCLTRMNEFIETPIFQDTMELEETNEDVRIQNGFLKPKKNKQSQSFKPF